MLPFRQTSWEYVFKRQTGTISLEHLPNIITEGNLFKKNQKHIYIRLELKLK